MEPRAKTQVHFQVTEGGAGREPGRCGEAVGLGVIQYGRVLWRLTPEVHAFSVVWLFP